MAYVVPEDVYERFKDEVIKHTNAVQRYEPGKKLRKLTDQEIADKLGLSVRDVLEIRCVAELEYQPLDIWEQAERFKLQRCGRSKDKE